MFEKIKTWWLWSKADQTCFVAEMKLHLLQNLFDGLSASSFIWSTRAGHIIVHV
jgi:hypothetical protein